MARASRIGLIVLACTFAEHARAQEPGSAPNRLQGFGPDAQIVGGGGFALSGNLDNNFVGRLRLGALYAYEPWLFNAGMTLEVGALAGVGLGGELEVNRFDGIYANVGLARIEHDHVMGHLGLGYLVFGVEWQHAFSGGRPSDALLLEVRLPVGYWWATTGRKKARSAPSSAALARPGAVRPPLPAAAQPIGPRSEQTDADTPPGSASAEPAAEGGASELADGASAELLLQRQHALDDATRAHDAGDHGAELAALERAYSLQRDPQLLLRIADASLAQSRLVPAAAALERFLDTVIEPSASREAPAVRARLATLVQRIPKLRLSLTNAHGDERVEVDGRAEPGALLGYDVRLEVGEHRVTVQRGAQRLVDEGFSAREHELIRRTFVLP
jgi:hypothetical protein